MCQFYSVCECVCGMAGGGSNSVSHPWSCWKCTCSLTRSRKGMGSLLYSVDNSPSCFGILQSSGILSWEAVSWGAGISSVSLCMMAWFLYLIVMPWVCYIFWGCLAELLGVTACSYGASTCGSVVVWTTRGKVTYQAVDVLIITWWSMYHEGLLKALSVKSCQLLVRWVLDPFTEQVLLTVPLWTP